MNYTEMVYIEELEFGEKYNHPIQGTYDHLQKLKIGMGFEETLDNLIIPETANIYIPRGFNNTLILEGLHKDKLVFI
jgi:hypothetical protein